MDKRPGAETNGKGESNGKGELNGKGSHLRVEPSQRRPAQISIRRPSPALPFFLVLCLVALAAFIVTIAAQEPTAVSPQPSVVPATEAFRLAVNRAMSASEVTQSAASQKEWQTIAAWWEEAVDLMKKVPGSSPSHSVAQLRIPSYQRNLQYARQKAVSAPVSNFSRSLWAKGSRRVDVIRIQGAPLQTERYDSLCKETLQYSGSTVELTNGIVARFEDIDRNLRAVADNFAIVSASGETAWTLDATKDDVFRVQGTPSRIIRYDASEKDVLYYGNSLVYLTNNRVVGYDDLDSNLRVTVAPSGSSDLPVDSWTINSPRDDIFRVQGTPTSVNLDNLACTETLKYGNSAIELKNGFVSGYNDLGKNLKVRVQTK